MERCSVDSERLNFVNELARLFRFLSAINSAKEGEKQKPGPPAAMIEGHPATSALGAELQSQPFALAALFALDVGIESVRAGESRSQRPRGRERGSRPLFVNDDLALAEWTENPYEL